MHLAAVLWAAVWTLCCIPAESGPLRAAAEVCGVSGGVVLFWLLWAVMAAAVEALHRATRSRFAMRGLSS